MKVKSVSLKHFKKFYDQQLSFADEDSGKARDLVLLFGENATGKSTLMQALAASLGVATGRLKRPEDLEWPGFEFSLVDRAWGFPPEVVLDIGFSPLEVQSTCDFFSQVPDFSENPDAILPSLESEVQLILDGGKVSAPNRAQYFQFRGREYARKLVRQSPLGFDLFKSVGSVFWYHEFRASTSLSMEEMESEIGFDENLLRRRLADWMFFHQRVLAGRYKLRPGQRDLYDDLERAYQSVFEDHRFEGSLPRVGEPLMDEPWFFLHDGQNAYEIGEMSSAERAIFPIIIDFATLNIHNSVILIDGFDVHLPLSVQETFLKTLPKLGVDNQFILSTHSEETASLFPEECIINLDALEYQDEEE